ncbi:hypothetical protein [Streptomyces sp. NPDC058382]|uniref:hypothetical protein n=1 Tax=unclassified Streptomyces TaxID=2593676 RepID=UPI003633468B
MNLNLNLTVSGHDDLEIEEFGQSSYQMQAALYTGMCGVSPILVADSAQHTA